MKTINELNKNAKTILCFKQFSLFTRLKMILESSYFILESCYYDYKSKKQVERFYK